MYGKYTVVSLNPCKMIIKIEDNPYEHLKRIPYDTNNEIKQIFNIQKSKREMKNICHYSNH